jgi:hypothetical protein
VHSSETAFVETQRILITKATQCQGRVRHRETEGSGQASSHKRRNSVFTAAERQKRTSFHQFPDITSKQQAGKQDKGRGAQEAEVKEGKREKPETRKTHRHEWRKAVNSRI